MRHLLIVLAMGFLTACASGQGSGLSSLGREVNVMPLRGQSAAQVLVDDGACETWTRATKNTETDTVVLPSAELRYAACMVARGYEARVTTYHHGPARLSYPGTRGLDEHLPVLRACRIDKLAPGDFDTPFEYRVRERALTCLQQAGYVVTRVEYTWPQDQTGRQ